MIQSERWRNIYLSRIFWL